MKIILYLVVLAISVVFLFFAYRNHVTQKNALEKVFLGGKIPNPSPNGFYKGTVTGLKTSWQGKKFNSRASTGINIFRENKKDKEVYPFKTYAGQGLADTELKVFKIDYNISENPFWLRLILDEIVETAPGKYLGKLHLRVFPGLSFALGYFQLRK